MLKTYFLKSDFNKNAFTMISGTLIAQAIPLALHPFLRRIFTPADFGAFAVYLNLLSIIVIISSFRYEAAIVLPKNDKESANIMAVSIVFNLFWAVFLILILAFFLESICNLINFPIQYKYFLFFLPLSASLYSIYQNLNYWLIKKKSFRAITINKIYRRSVEGIIQISIGYFMKSVGLFLGDLMGNLMNVISGIRQIKKNNFSFHFISYKKMQIVLQKYADFPKYNLIPTLLSNLATTLPLILINMFFSNEIAGYVDLSRIVLSIPLAFISVTISQVLFQQITDKKNKNLSIKSDIINILKILLVIVIIEYIIIEFWGPWLFGFVFGSQYYISGDFSRILIFSFALNFIASSYSSVFISLKKLKILGIWQVLYFFGICSLFLFNSLSIYKFIKIYVFIEMLAYITYIIILFIIVRKYEKKNIK